MRRRRVLGTSPNAIITIFTSHWIRHHTPKERQFVKGYVCYVFELTDTTTSSIITSKNVREKASHYLNERERKTH